MTMPTVRSRRHAFTLIEVLAICAMIALLLAILAPAIQEARDRVRTTKCRSNLKALGLALEYYQDTFRYFPPGYIAATRISDKDQSREMTWNSGWGWQAFVLPYIDQAPLYLQLDFMKGVPTAVDKAATTKLVAFRCPEDTGSPLVAKVKVLGTLPVGRKTTIVEKGFARSNYVGVAGWDNDWYLGIDDNPNKAADDAASNWSKLEVGKDFQDGIVVYAGSLTLKGKTPVPNARDSHGMLGEISSRSDKDIVDGASNTFVVGERATPTKNTSETDVGNAIWAGVPDRSTRAGQALSLGTSYWPINHEVTAKSIPNTTGLNSRHVGSAHLLAADGKVHAVSEKIDLGLLRRLCVIDDRTKGPIDIPTVE